MAHADHASDPQPSARPAAAALQPASAAEPGSQNQPRAFPVAVLISGGGTTLRNLIDLRAAGQLPLDFRLVISSNSRARGLEYAVANQIPHQVLVRGHYDSVEAYGEAIFSACRAAGAELVVMGGFLKQVAIPADYVNRVINIHPSLIPAFCGHGFYGHHVHEAVVNYGVKLSGCTVHFVDNHYDHGPIILQRSVPVIAEDTPESLAARVFAQECIALPEAIRLFIEGRLEVLGRVVRIAEGRASRSE
ncbi:MAG: phosphoribosylglycinamide formyltransferase [Planctomycetota bacterium]